MSVSNRTLAKNTAFLYTGTLVNLLISLYTSRVVLNTLGVVDYGIYSVVGSVISMVTVLNLFLTTATSRFLTIEIGRNNQQRLAETFNSAMIGLLFLSFVVALILEATGIYLLNSKLVIPPERLSAAHFVFHLSIVSMLITTTQQPYTAAITSHEHFGIYTMMDILNSALKLSVVFLLMFGDFDKLKLYAVLLLASTITMSFVYRIYCIRHFPECRLHWHVNLSILKQMLKYSSWSIIGNTAGTYQQQGANMILNMFFGPVLNAANGIAMTVEGAIMGFAFQPITAFRFQIVKAYAAQEFERMCQFIYNAARFSTLLLLVVAVPVFFETHYVLSLWLGLVPEYVVIFIRLLLVSAVLRLNTMLVLISIGASPHVRNVNLFNSVVLLVQLPLLYVIFRIGGTPSSLYILGILGWGMALLVDLVMLRNIITGFSVRKYISHGLLRNVPVIIVLSLLLLIIQINVHEGLFRLLITCALSVLLFAAYFYYIVIDKHQREMVLSRVRKFF